MDGQATGAGGKDDPRLALSIVVPAFNEVTRLGVGIERLQAAVDHGAVDVGVTEFVVVDDGSTDGTAELARDLYGRYPQSTVLRLPANAGKGAAIRRGVASARGAAIAFMDADMAVDPRQIPLLVGALDHADVAIASRALPGSSADHDRLGRTMMGWAFNQIVNAATHVSVGDTQCGFKAFRTPVARLLFHSSTIDRFAFDVEVLYTARRLGLRIAEVPVRWSNAQGTRIRPLRDPLSMLSDVLLSRIGSRPAKLVEAVSVSADAARRSGAGPRAQLGRPAHPGRPLVGGRRPGAPPALPSRRDRPDRRSAAGCLRGGGGAPFDPPGAATGGHGSARHRPRSGRHRGPAAVARPAHLHSCCQTLITRRTEFPRAGTIGPWPTAERW